MTEQIYTDKEILADALTAEKAATNNYNASSWMQCSCSKQ